MQVLFISFVGTMSPFCLVQHTGEFSFLFVWALNSCHLLGECLPGNSLWDSFATMDLKGEARVWQYKLVEGSQ